MCGHFFDHGIGKVLATVAPIAAAFIPGVGPLASAALVAGTAGLSSKLQGGSWGDALKAGALSGITAGAAPVLGNAFAGIAPETAGSLGVTGGYDTVFGKGFGGGALSGLSGLSGASGAAPTGAEQISGALANADPSLSNAVQTGAPAGSAVGPTQGLSSGTENFLAGLGGGASTGAASTGGDGLLSGALSKITSNPLGAAAAALTLTNALQGNKVNGEQNQAQILAQQQAQQAQQAQFSKQTIDALNSASLGRSPVNPNISDYYTYGTRPEATFFTNSAPIHYGA